VRLSRSCMAPQINLLPDKQLAFSYLTALAVVPAITFWARYEIS
jgi:hypothetical protein